MGTRLERGSGSRSRSAFKCSTHARIGSRKKIAINRSPVHSLQNYPATRRRKNEVQTVCHPLQRSRVCVLWSIGQTLNALRFIFNTNIGINCTDSKDADVCVCVLECSAVYVNRTYSGNRRRMVCAQIEQNKYKLSHTIYTLIYFTLNVHTLLFCSTQRAATAAQ